MNTVILLTQPQSCAETSVMTRELFCYLAVKTNILYRLEAKQVMANNHLRMIAPDENETLACTCSQIHKKIHIQPACAYQKQLLHIKCFFCILTIINKMNTQ